MKVLSLAVAVAAGLSCLTSVFATDEAVSMTANSDGSLKHEVDPPGSNGDTDNKPSIQKSIESLVDWIRKTPGGFVHEDLEVQRNGIFVRSSANRAIAPNELLLTIPEQCIVFGDPTEAFEFMQCSTIEHFLAEIRQGNESRVAPYLQFYTDFTDATPGVMPSLYSEAGQKWVRAMVGSMKSRHSVEQRLPPEEVTGWMSYEYVRGCKGSHLNMRGEHTAAGWSVARGWGEKLIPLFDIINHHKNSDSVNTRNNIVDGEDHPNLQDVMVYSTDSIAPGEQLFTTFGMIHTPELFRDSGIIEVYPQTFHMPELPQQLTFRLMYEYDESTENYGEELELQWMRPPPEDAEETLQYLGTEVNRLQKLGDDFESQATNVPEYERVMIGAFHRTMLTAVTMALQALELEANPEKLCGDDGSCEIRDSRYSRLDEEFDDTFKSVDTCDQETELDLSHHETLHEVQSPYQFVSFDQDPANNNTCFMLDSIYQICTSYRPHYHEVMVHVPARFMKEIKRVIFIGGGDSMLLHEVLKYPTLEMVIGLELDQVVTRNSFKYFGTQPHWDNEKVQWWFGDAAKSLLMLPKEYFGTFDLVLVDLSETVMSNTVTKGLDIMSALSLLLKQDGIFLKNEMYFHTLQNVFQHTIQLHYYGVPLVCSQCMVLGSNAIDFIQTELIDHDVETIHEPAIKPDRDFSLVHDYMNNPNSERHCKSDDDDEEPSEQERSPGILMIVEAENVKGKLDTAADVKSAMDAAVKACGLSLVETTATENEAKGSIITCVLKEGYVVARADPSQNHVALDIHLWSGFDKLEDAKTSLLDAFGAKRKDASSFRIVAPGLFGVSTWKEDEMKKGPKFTQDCGEGKETESKSEINDGHVAAVLEESMKTLMIKEDATVAVLCGASDEPCDSVKVLEDHAKVSSVIPLYQCSTIEGKIEYERDAGARKFKCEKEILSTLQAENSIVDAIVVDPSTSYAMAQIMHKIISSTKSRRELMNKDFLALAPALDSSESWRRIFIDQLREFYSTEPGFKSTVFFNSTTTSMEVTTVSSGDLHFINNLKALTAEVEKRTGLVGDIRHIGGVEYTMQDPFEPPQFFLHDAYDQKSPYGQWQSQQPTGHQVMFQLEATLKKSLSSQIVKNLASKALNELGIDTSLEEFAEFGDGIALFATWTGGNIIILWDGRSSVGVNLFIYEESDEFVSAFEKEMVGRSLKVALRDEMPRGHGRVVNFKKDIGDRADPAWAMVLADK